MSYLLDLVRSFDAEETNAFRKLDLKGNEELIRDTYANNALSKKFDEAALPGKFNLSQSHFDKITSILLDKTISKLYGADYNKVLFTILNKGLSGLAFHEMKIMERRALKEKSKENNALFYKAVFDFCRRMYHPGYNPKLTHAYGEKYLQALGKAKTIADESMVANLAFHADAIAASVSGNEDKFKPAAEKHIKLWQQKLANSKNAVARFYAAYAHGSYFKYYTEDVEGFTTAILKAYKAYLQTNGEIPLLLKGAILCELGFGYLSLNRFAEAQPYYAQAYNEFNDTIGKHIYHTGNYVLVCIMNKDFKTAQQVFDDALWPKTNSNINRSVLFDVYSAGCLLNLHQQQMGEAFRYIEIMVNYGKNEITPIGHGFARQLQTLYFVTTGDYNTAAALIKKNLKYFGRMKAKGGGVSNYLYRYMDVLDKIVKHKQGKLRSPEKLRRHIEDLQGGMFMLYNSLLYNLPG